MKTYTIEIRMYEEEYEPKFAFNAEDKEDADNKAFGWVRYHGMTSNDYRVREATEEEKEYRMHNEYIR